MELLKSDFQTISNLFNSAKAEIIFSTPSITEEIAEAIIFYQERGIRCIVFLEFDETTYRSGFGDIKAITRLRERKIEFMNKKHFNVYFLIIDNHGYFYFPKSLFFEKEGTSFDLFPMEKFQVKKLKLMFNLLDDEDPEFLDLVDEVGIEQLTEISKGLEKIDETQAKKLETILTNDPPLKPDLGRTLEVYKAKFQIVELKFKGGNMHVKKIQLPGKALPFKDDNLKRAIEANLRLFTDIPEKEFLQPFFQIKTDLEKIREQFMFYIKLRDKNIMKRLDKVKFENQIDDLIKNIETIKSELLNKLQDEINTSRQRIKKNLLDFLKDNPPKDFDGLKDNALEKVIKNATNKIISSIKFPMAKDLLNDMSLEYHYYDITWEDLNNKEVLKELQKHELITDNEKSYIGELAIKAEIVK